MKSKKRKLGDVGIRLKPKESNILENYTKYRKRTKKKKKKSKKKKSFKSVEIREKKDPLLQIVEDSKNKLKKEEISIEELDDKSDKVMESRTIRVDSKPKDLSETDPNVKKTVMITASLKPEKNKEGGGVLLE